jgi:hypothetical protein
MATTDRTRWKEYGYWTLKRCKADAKKYSSRAQWQKKSKSAYTAALRNSWVDSCTSHMKKAHREFPANFWTKKTCALDARQFDSKKDWETESQGAYLAAIRNGWFEDCTRHMPARKTKLTLDFCVIEAKKYTSRIEWKRGSNTSYQKALKSKWMDLCCAHMPVKARSGSRGA